MTVQTKKKYSTPLLNTSSKQALETRSGSATGSIVGEHATATSQPTICGGGVAKNGAEAAKKARSEDFTHQSVQPHGMNAEIGSRADEGMPVAALGFVTLVAAIILVIWWLL